MGRKARLCATIVVVASSLLWLLLVAGIVTRPVQAYRGSAVSVEVTATVSPQATPTKGQPAQHGKTVQNEQVPSWVTLILLLIGCAVLLAVLGFMLWIGGLVPWHRRSQPAGWRYEVLLALLAGLVAVVAVALQVFAAFTLPVWFHIVLFALAVVLALAVPVVRLRSTQLEKQRSWARQVRGLLQVPLGADSQLPRLSALSPYRLGVSPSTYGNEEQRGDDPYVSRRFEDDELDKALLSKRFVLLVGDSKAGKSRTAYEAAARLRHVDQPHCPRVLVPRSPDLLEQLLDLDPPLDLGPELALLWLDDLTENELAALTPALLDRLTGQMILLGTMSALRHALVMGSDSEIGRDARLALQRATEIRLDAVLKNDERVEAEQKYPKERFKAGIGEQLVAVDKLTSRYVNARQGANPHGWAVVQAAIDWMRMDVGRPIRQHELVALCPLYLHELRPLAEHDDKGHEEALLWACEPVVSHSALLEKLPSDLGELPYKPFDYLVAAVDGQDGRLPQLILDSAWDKVLALVSPSEAVRAGISAYRRQLRPHAQKIFTAVTAEYSEAVPQAAFVLGVLLYEQGDLERAKAAWQQAIDTGDAKWAPSAAFILGGLLHEKEGDLEGAKAAYQRAIDTGQAETVSKAAFNLGVLLKEQGDLEGAKAAWQQAIDTGDAEWAPRATVAFGVLLEQQSDLEGAKAAYQRAIDTGQAEWAPRAAFILGDLLRQQGDLEGAKAAYQQAIDSGHAELAPKAAFNLGVLLKEQDDLEGAKAAYRQAIDSGHAEQAPKAAYNLGVLLKEQGDLEGAKASYQLAIDSGHAELPPRAAVALGIVHQQQGDLEGAKAAYQRAIDTGKAETASQAALNLGRLLYEQGDLEGAKTVWQQAIDTGDAEWAPRAAFALGVLLEQQGDLEGAKAAYQQAIDTGHAEVVPRAAFILGQTLRQQGDLGGAKAAYQQAIDTGDAEWASVAAASLGSLLLEEGDLEGAKAAYQRAVDSGHAELTLMAAEMGELLKNIPPPTTS